MKRTFLSCLAAGTACLAGGTALLATMLLISGLIAGFGRLHPGLDWLLIVGVGAVITLMALSLTRLFGKTCRHIGISSLLGAALTTTNFAIVAVLLKAPDNDVLAWAAVAAYGLAAGFFGSLTRRLLKREGRPKLDFVPLVLAFGAVSGLGLWAVTHPVQMPATAHLVHVHNLEEYQKEVVQSELPVVVDFNATWCGPCREVAPAIDKAAQKLAGKVKFVSVDVDVMRKSGVADLDKLPGLNENAVSAGIPRLVHYRNGHEIGREVGYTEVDEWLKLHTPK